MFIKPTLNLHRRQTGVSLVEVIIFIVLMGVGVAGLMQLMGGMMRNSADPMIQKQALSVAESLLEEVMLQPFTDCDPDAYNVDTGACTHAEQPGPETIGASPQQTRYSTTNPFNNVNDYHNFSMPAPPGIHSIENSGTPILGLEQYSATVNVSNAGGDFGIGAGDALRIVVSVTDPLNQITTLTGYRFKYAPTP